MIKAQKDRECRMFRNPKVNTTVTWIIILCIDYHVIYHLVI